MSALTIFSVKDPQNSLWHSTNAEEIQQQLNARLAQASNPHLHPEGMEFLALAVAPNLA